MKTKMCSISLPIDKNIYEELRRHCDQLKKLEGMPEFTPESCIADAIILHHVKPLNEFLRSYVGDKFGHYPKRDAQKKIPIFLDSVRTK